MVRKRALKFSDAVEKTVQDKVTVIDDGITTITTPAKSLQDMVAEMALEINNKVVAWVGDRHDCNIEIYRQTDRDQYLLVKDGKTVDKLILVYTPIGIKELTV